MKIEKLDRKRLPLQSHITNKSVSRIVHEKLEEERLKRHLEEESRILEETQQRVEFEKIQKLNRKNGLMRL